MSRRSGGSPCGSTYASVDYIVRRLELARKEQTACESVLRLLTIDIEKLEEKGKCAKKTFLPFSLSLSLYAGLKSDKTNICLVPMHRDFATPSDTQAQKEDKPRFEFNLANRYFRAALNFATDYHLSVASLRKNAVEKKKNNQSASYGVPISNDTAV